MGGAVSLAEVRGEEEEEVLERLLELAEATKVGAGKAGEGITSTILQPIYLQFGGETCWK